jgi:lysocardiolipin and lysophospholipid acyltransferase
LYFAVYDVTIAYKHHLPVFLDNVFGTDPAEVHLHIQRIRLDEIPSSEAESANWLIERFRLKDELLANFISTGHFPNEGTEGDLPTLMCLLRLFLVIGFTGVIVYLTFFCSVLFKIYVGLSCIFLSIITHYGIQMPQLLGHRADLHEKRS